MPSLMYSSICVAVLTPFSLFPFTTHRGAPSSGKTAIAAKIAVESGFPFVRMISADEMIGYSDVSKSTQIHKVFMDSYRSPLSLIFLDDIERLIEYVPILSLIHI